MSNANKEVLYIDVDDEITAIIDKLTVSKAKIVALVLPKRATVLQSIVNMKLLKRSADEANKHVVLITSEQGLLPLAGAVGLHVAKTPQSKPEIPSAPTAREVDDTDEITADEMADFDRKQHASRSVGELAGVAAVEDTIDLDNGSSDDAPKKFGAAVAAAQKLKPKKGKDKKLKVPNFGTFRNRLIFGGIAAVFLLGFLIYALIAMPKATIAIGTDSEEITSTLDVRFDATASDVDVEAAVVPSVVERMDRTDSQTVPATGERNDGDKAEGAVVMSAQVCDLTMPDPQPVPAGTGVSAGSLTYITTESARFSLAGREGRCLVYRTGSTKMTAAEGGTKYNVKNQDFTVAGRGEVSATGSADDGTDKITKVVAEADIKTATDRLEGQGTDTIRAELARRLEERNVVVLEKSLSVINPEITSSVEVGAEAEEVVVTRKASYALIGAKEEDLNTLISGIVEEELDKDRQKVLNTGLSDAVFELQNQQNNAALVLMSMNVTSLIGPEIIEETIKEQVAGMKSAEAELLISSNPGITSVDVTYGPFWVSSIPKNVDKITITYEN